MVLMCGVLICDKFNHMDFKPLELVYGGDHDSIWNFGLGELFAAVSRAHHAILVAWKARMPKETDRQKLSTGEFSLGNKNYKRNGARSHSGNVLANNLTFFYSYPKELSEAEFILIIFNLFVRKKDM